MSTKIKTCTYRVSSAVTQGEVPESFMGFEKELCEGAVRGLDIDQLGGFDEWIKWLGWSSAMIDENDYLKAALHALRLAPRIAATDYGTARQRDLGQLWADTIRGFLGEIAFVKWLREKYGLSATLDYKRGSLEEFLASDIKNINGRQPRLKISIKTTKLNGIWLDVPGAQIEHSDVYILVRVGITREHLIAFFKKISVIRDKFMKTALERGLLREEELGEIWDSIPEFSSLPAYVAGFLEKAEFSEDIKNKYSIIEADGEVKVKRIIVNRYLGFWHPEDETYAKNLMVSLKRKGRSVSDQMKIAFEGIGEFSRTLHFIASSGVLKKRKEDWQNIIRKI